MPILLDVTALDDPQGRAFRYEFDADRRQILLGRRGGVDVLLPHPRVSLVHARIERRSGGWVLTDEGSTNGTRLNGLQLDVGQPRPLKDGDRIAIADFQVQVALREKALDWQAESSSSLARRMASEVLERLGPGDAHPRLEVLDGPQAGVRLSIEAQRTYVLGRAAQGDLRLDDVDMWRERAALERTDEGITIRELAPSAQLEVEGERVAGARRLSDGEVVRFGGSRLVYRDPAEVYLKRLEAAPDEPEPGASTRARTRSSPAWPTARRAIDRAFGAPYLRRGPSELVLAVVGAVIALAAAIALVWVLAS